MDLAHSNLMFSLNQVFVHMQETTYARNEAALLNDSIKCFIYHHNNWLRNFLNNYLNSTLRRNLVNRNWQPFAMQGLLCWGQQSNENVCRPWGKQTNGFV